jgi:plasmid segregation protein ParM
MSKHFLVAVDDGYAQTKLYGETPEGYIKKEIIRSSVRSGRYGLTSITGVQEIGCYETEEKETFTVSSEIESENTQFDSFHISSMNRVLVNHALLAANYSGVKVDLIAGLPVDNFFTSGEKNLHKIEQKKKNLLKSVKNLVNPNMNTDIQSVRIGCQAIAAFVDYFLDENLNEKDVPVERVAIVDIGGRTTDIAIILAGSKFDEKYSGTANMGVLDVYNVVAQGIRKEFDTNDKYSLSLLDKVVRTKKIRLWSQDHDVSHIVDKAVLERENEIAREIERKIGNASNTDVVLFVGGGSALFKNIANHFRNGVIADDPEFANARGLYKYAKRFPE